MPTGYTAKLMEKGQSFPEFVMQCARAFGALIELRDDPMDAPIPEKFEPSSFHVERLKEAEAQLKRLSAMTPAEQLAYGESLRDQNLKMWGGVDTKAVAENDRLDAMVQQINKWHPPTKDHRGLKDFMLEQLRISRNTVDWSATHETHKAKPPLEYFTEALYGAQRDIKYHTEEQAKEEQRARERTAWVRKLRESLKSTH